VPALLDNDAAKIAVKADDPFRIETKPDGHREEHALLCQHGLPEKWENDGKKWVVFFQKSRIATTTPRNSWRSPPSSRIFLATPHAHSWMGPHPVLLPSFAETIETMKEKVKCPVKISGKSTLILEGDVTIEKGGLELNGALELRAAPGGWVGQYCSVPLFYCNFCTLSQEKKCVASVCKHWQLQKKPLRLVMILAHA